MDFPTEEKVVVSWLRLHKKTTKTKSNMENISVSLRHGVRRADNISLSANTTVAEIIRQKGSELALPESFNVSSNVTGIINDISSRVLRDGEILTFEKKAASKAA